MSIELEIDLKQLKHLYDLAAQQRNHLIFRWKSCSWFYKRNSKSLFSIDAFHAKVGTWRSFCVCWFCLVFSSKYASEWVLVIGYILNRWGSFSRKNGFSQRWWSEHTLLETFFSDALSRTRTYESLSTASFILNTLQ